MVNDEVNLADLFEAKSKIYSVVRRTPLKKSVALSKEIGSNIYYKCEFMQNTRSFKVRGAANFILNLSEEQRKRGVVTYSTGNHGRAVAHIAKLLGSQAKVCLSNKVPENKRLGIKMAGGKLVVYGESQDEAQERAIELRDEEGLAVVAPFDDPYIIAGQGAIGLEIFDELSVVDTVLVPLSGGGLASGVAMAVKSIKPDCRVIGVSMEDGAAMYASQEAGKPVQVEEVDSLADSLQGGILLDNKYTFDMVKEYVDDIILVSEEEIERAMAYAFLKDHIVLEGAAAVGIAALLEQKVSDVGENVVTITSGSNVDNELFLSIVQKHRDDFKR
jgi:threonine dehydratase